MSLLLSQLGAAPPAEAETLSPLSVRLVYRGFGRALGYVWNPARDIDVAAPIEASTLAQFLVRLPFRSLGPNRYLRSTAQDFSVVTPLDLPSVVRSIPYKSFGRNPYLRSLAVDGAEQVAVVEDVGGSVMVVPNWDGLRLTVASRLAYHRTAQDFDFVVIPDVADTGGSILTVWSLESWRLSRAGRFYFWTTAQDFDAGAVVSRAGMLFHHHHVQGNH